MLNSENTLFAINDIKDEHLESARALLGYKVEEAPRHIARKRIITFALAAALILGLGTAAYAAGLFGIRALFIKDSASADIPDSGLLSLTQPQEVPEEMDAEIRRKIDNSTEAWAEWDTWRKSNGIFQPDVFVWPDDCVCDGCEDNGDGTWTVIFYAPISASYDEDGNLLGYYDGFREIASQQGVMFTDASEWGIDLGYDQVHFSAEGHRTFAGKMTELIREIR